MAKLAFGTTESSTTRAKMTLVYADELGMESTVRDTFSFDKLSIILLLAALAFVFVFVKTAEYLIHHTSVSHASCILSAVSGLFFRVRDRPLEKWWGGISPKFMQGKIAGKKINAEWSEFLFRKLTRNKILSFHCQVQSKNCGHNLQLVFSKPRKWGQKQNVNSC